MMSAGARSCIRRRSGGRGGRRRQDFLALLNEGWADMTPLSFRQQQNETWVIGDRPDPFGRRSALEREAEATHGENFRERGGRKRAIFRLRAKSVGLRATSLSRARIARVQARAARRV